jgi:hypothetical protein
VNRFWSFDGEAVWFHATSLEAARRAERALAHRKTLEDTREWPENPTDDIAWGIAAQRVVDGKLVDAS